MSDKPIKKPAAKRAKKGTGKPARKAAGAPAAKPIVTFVKADSDGFEQFRDTTLAFCKAMGIPVTADSEQNLRKKWEEFHPAQPEAGPQKDEQ